METISLDEYLGREFQGVNPTDDFERDVNELTRGNYTTYASICEELIDLCQSPDTPCQSIEQSENELYEFVYSYPELEIFLNVKFNPNDAKSSIPFIQERLVGRETVLDLGCGNGLKTVFYALNGESRITAVDKSQKALDLLLKRAQRYGVEDRIELVNANLLEMDLGRTFDAIVAAKMIHECGDIRTVSHESNMHFKMDKIDLHLSPGGVAIITSGGYSIPYEVALLMSKRGFKDVNRHTIFKHGDEDQTIMGVVGYK
nr:hypothetical protein [Nanoarchaeum sp.]